MSDIEKENEAIRANMHRSWDHAIHGLARHITMPDGGRSFRYMQYDAKNGVTIPIPDAWRAERPGILPSFVSSLSSKGARPFPAHYRTPDIGALCFWLDPSIIRSNRDMNMPLTPDEQAKIEAQVRASVEALEDKLGISELTYRIFFPTEPLRSRLSSHSCAAVALGVPPQEYKQLAKITAQLKTLQQLEPPGGSWAQKFLQTDSYADDVALSNLTDFMVAPPEFHNLEHLDGLTIQSPMVGAYTPQETHHIDYRSDEVSDGMLKDSNAAVVLWLDRTYRGWQTPRRFDATSGLDYPADDTYGMPTAQDFLHAEVDEFLKVLEKRLHIRGLEYHFSEPLDVDSPVALIIHSLDEKQQVNLQTLNETIDQLWQKKEQEKARSTRSA